MASPTRAEIEAQGTAGVKVLERERVQFDTQLVSDCDALVDVLEGDYTPSGLQAFVRTVRSRASDCLDPLVVQALFGPLFREYGKFAGFAEASDGDFFDLLRRIKDYMADNSLAITSRQITYTAPSAGGSNVGNGTLVRLSVGDRGESLECCTVETKTAECVQDLAQGATQHAEVFLFRGANGPIDRLSLASYGSGMARSVRAFTKHAGVGDGGSLLVNSSFDTYSSGATQPFAGWDVDTAANIAQDTTNYHRHAPGSSTNGSLKFTGNAVLSQKIAPNGIPAIQLSRFQPYCLELMYNREVGVGDGTLRIRMGATTVTVALAAQTGWNKLRLTMNSGLWMRTFDESSMDITVELASRTTGYVLVDDVIFAPMIPYDGTWWWLVGGTTAFVMRDVFSAADSGGAPATGKISYWLWRAGLISLPSSTGGSVTWADP